MPVELLRRAVEMNHKTLDPFVQPWLVAAKFDRSLLQHTRHVARETKVWVRTGDGTDARPRNTNIQAGPMLSEAGNSIAKVGADSVVDGSVERVEAIVGDGLAHRVFR